MIPRPEDLIRVLPETLWCIFGVLLMLLQPFTRNRHVLSFFALLGAILGTSATIYAYTTVGAGSAFRGLIQLDAFSIFFHLLVGSVSILVVLISGPYLERENLESAEFFALVLFATAGMGVLSAAQELLTAFIMKAVRSSWAAERTPKPAVAKRTSAKNSADSRFSRSR